MKANVPEKIYIPQNDTLESGLEDFWVDHQVFLSEIEYIRTDAFIEKACKWLEKNIAEATGIDSYTITESFKQAMKKE